MKLLFIGNSATYVHEIPQTLARLSAPLGYTLEVEQITRGGFTLAKHSDPSTLHGQTVLSELQKGYDVVFLQDNGNCIMSDGMREACSDACSRLIQAARAGGARPMLYVRPPYGTPADGRSPIEQCHAFDGLFGSIAREWDVDCVFVNRAFAAAIEQTDIPLWGPDNAHTSAQGAYLAVCVFFATLFAKSATLLGTNGLPMDEARTLQQIADAVVRSQNL